MSFRMRPFVGVVIRLGILLVLLSPVASLAQFLPYEDWQDGLIHASRWSGGEDFGGQEIVREVITSGPTKQLQLRYRRQGSTGSNSGNTASAQFLFDTNSANVNGIQATFTVTDLSMTVCAANNSAGATSARPARLLMEKFNDGTQSVPGDRTGDYHAFVEAFRDGNSSSPPGVLNVRGVIIRCSNASCSTSTTIVSNTLATTVSVGQTFTLRLKWDQPAHQFLFGLDNAADVALPYAATDIPLANSMFVDIHVFHRTANCAAGAVAIDSTTLVGAVNTITGTTVAAVLPLSRSVQVGGAPATAFAVMINTGSAVAVNCRPAPPASPPANLGTFTYQTTTPANALSGTPNTPANIAAGAFQNYVFGFTPTGPIAETSLAMQFICDTATAAPQYPGVNNLFIVADTSPVPDTIALMATVSGDGVVRIPGSGGTQLFAIGTSNVGATGTIVVSGDTGGVGLPLTLTVCETTGGPVCLAPPTPTVTVNYAGGTNRSFAFFAQASGSIPFDPANSRVFARLTETGVQRGATSAAVCTTPNAGC